MIKCDKVGYAAGKFICGVGEGVAAWLYSSALEGRIPLFFETGSRAFNSCTKARFDSSTSEPSS